MDTFTHARPRDAAVVRPITGDTAPKYRTVSLLDVDPALADGIPADDLNRARRGLAVPVATVEVGPWRPETLAADHGDGCLMLVVSGAIARDTALQRRPMTQLFGPGDVAALRVQPIESLPCTITHVVEATAQVAILDARFQLAARVWPSVGKWVQDRLCAQAERVARQAAILALPRVEERVLATFWHLAEIWGRVRGDGILLPLPLTHERIGRMTGAQRPTVSLALRALHEAGDADRVPEGWLLRSGSEERLGGDTGSVVALPTTSAG